jgi:hypothetical protein
MHFFRDAGPCVASVPISSQKLIVLRFRVTNMGYHGQIDGLIGEALCGCRPADPAAILQTGVFRDGHFSSGRALRVKLPHASRKPPNVLLVKLCSIFSLPLTSPRADFGVGQALHLGLLQRVSLDQQSVPFVPLASLAPLEHNRS